MLLLTENYVFESLIRKSWDRKKLLIDFIKDYKTSNEFEIINIIIRKKNSSPDYFCSGVTKPIFHLSGIQAASDLFIFFVI